jgi:hypothetical protein
VSRQDPQALGMLPLDGIVTDKPAVRAGNKLAEALEAGAAYLQQRTNSGPRSRRRWPGSNCSRPTDGTTLKTQADAMVESAPAAGAAGRAVLAPARAEVRSNDRGLGRTG